MIKQTPSIGRLVAMAAFTLSVFAILIFLWLAFGGTVPLKPEGYRFTVHMPEAATLAEEADVRMAMPSSPWRCGSATTIAVLRVQGRRDRAADHDVARRDPHPRLLDRIR